MSDGIIGFFEWLKTGDNWAWVLMSGFALSWFIQSVISAWRKK
jgi:hypothetical protein